MLFLWHPICSVTNKHLTKQLRLTELTIFFRSSVIPILIFSFSLFTQGCKQQNAEAENTLQGKGKPKTQSILTFIPATKPVIDEEFRIDSLEDKLLNLPLVWSFDLKDPDFRKWLVRFADHVKNTLLPSMVKKICETRNHPIKGRLKRLEYLEKNFGKEIFSHEFGYFFYKKIGFHIFWLWQDIAIEDIVHKNTQVKKFDYCAPGYVPVIFKNRDFEKALIKNYTEYYKR